MDLSPLSLSRDVRNPNSSRLPTMNATPGIFPLRSITLWVLAPSGRSSIINWGLRAFGGCGSLMPPSCHRFLSVSPQTTLKVGDSYSHFTNSLQGIQIVPQSWLPRKELIFCLKSGPSHPLRAPCRRPRWQQPLVPQRLRKRPQPPNPQLQLKKNQKRKRRKKNFHDEGSSNLLIYFHE